MLTKSLILWAAMIPMAIANGAFREAFLVPRIGPIWARTVSGLSLSALILAFAVGTIGWLPAARTGGYLCTGALWLGCTVSFEFIAGHFVARKPWAILLGAYTFKGGELWPVVLLVVAFAPYVAARIRGLV